MLRSKVSIRCKDCLSHVLSKLKPKFSERCTNCLQQQPTPKTSSDEEQVETAAKIEFLPSTPLVKPHSSSSGSETKPMEPGSKVSIRCKDCLTHRLSKLKPKFSERCTNYLQQRPSPRTSYDEEQVEATAKIEFLPSTPLVKPYSSSFWSETKPMEPESTPVKATQARSSPMKKKKRPNSETETTPSKRVKDEVQDLVPPHSMLRNLASESQTQMLNPNLQKELGNLS